MINNLVRDYISNKRTIILAVVSAMNDYANQSILKLTREVDPNGSRTLGVITKADAIVDMGEEGRQKWFDLMLNKDIFLELGWHMLRNRKDHETKLDLTERNEKENTLFAGDAFCQIPPHQMGVERLRTRLSTLLSQHLQREVPALSIELRQRTEETEKELDQLGTARSSLEERKDYLMDVYTDAGHLLDAGIQGHYSNKFFEKSDLAGPAWSKINSRRLRAAVQELNMRFSNIMHTDGKKYSFPDAAGDGDAKPAPNKFGDSSSGNDNKASENGGESAGEGESEKKPGENIVEQISLEKPIPFSRNEALEWALKIIRRSRGVELPGVFNHQIISQLFWDQSSKWETCARAHLDSIMAVCENYVTQVLDNVAAPEVKARLKVHTIDDILRETHNMAVEELSKIVEDMKRPPMTYNHYFTDTLQKLQSDKVNCHFEDLDAQKNIFNGIAYIRLSTINAKKNNIEQDMEKVAANQALDTQAAYYKDECKYFIGVVTKQVIERHLIQTLPKLLSARMVNRLTVEEIDYLAAEPLDVTSRRQMLQERMRILKKGQEEFKTVLRGY